MKLVITCVSALSTLFFTGRPFSQCFFFATSLGWYQTGHIRSPRTSQWTTLVRRLIYCLMHALQNIFHVCHSLRPFPIPMWCHFPPHKRQHNQQKSIFPWYLKLRPVHVGSGRIFENPWIGLKQQPPSPPLLPEHLNVLPRALVFHPCSNLNWVYVSSRCRWRACIRKVGTFLEVDELLHASYPPVTPVPCLDNRNFIDSHCFLSEIHFGIHHMSWPARCVLCWRILAWDALALGAFVVGLLNRRVLPLCHSFGCLNSSTPWSDLQNFLLWFFHNWRHSQEWQENIGWRGQRWCRCRRSQNRRAWLTLDVSVGCGRHRSHS